MVTWAGGELMVNGKGSGKARFVCDRPRRERERERAMGWLIELLSTAPAELLCADLGLFTDSLLLSKASKPVALPSTESPFVQAQT